MSAPLLSAVLVVKDEAASIRGVLEAVKPYVDRITVVDTGSTDSTKDIVREVLDGFPYTLVEDDRWLGYVDHRNRALDIDADVETDDSDATCFQLVLSADEYLRDGDKLRADLEKYRDSGPDLFRIHLTLDGDGNHQPRIFRTKSAWKYVDAGIGVHEFPAHPDPNATVGAVAGLIEHVVSDPEKRYSNIWESHIPRLRAALDEDPKNERALIFLAKDIEIMLQVAGPEERVSLAMEAMSLYLRRLQLPTGADNERNYVKYSYLDVARYAGVYSVDELIIRADELCEEDPSRPENHLLRVRIMNMRKMPMTEIYGRAVETAAVAKAATNIEAQSPVSGSVEWKAQLIAARAARAIADQNPGKLTPEGLPFMDVVRRHVEAGIAAGGPEREFRSMMEAVVPPSAVDNINTAAAQT